MWQRKRMLFCWRSREELSPLTLSERGGPDFESAVGQQADAVGQNLINLYELDLHSGHSAFGLHSPRISTQNMALEKEKKSSSEALRRKRVAQSSAGWF